MGYHPPHVYRLEDFSTAVEHMAGESPCDIEFLRGHRPAHYLRQPFPNGLMHDIFQEMGLDASIVTKFSVYCSDIGSVTNFHFDKSSGCIHQCHGRKEVILVHPRFSGYMRAHDNERRSWFVSEKRALTVPHWKLIVHPGDCL